MKKKRNRFFGLLLLSIALLLLAASYFFDDNIMRVLTIATAIFGAFAFWFEMRTVHEIAEGEFILNLNNCFNDNPELNSFYKRLYFNDPLTEKDWESLIIYLTFFETLLVLIKRNIISFDLIDDLFSSRFFSLSANVQVQERDLLKYPDVNRNIFTLDYMWRAYRKKTGQPAYPNSILDEHPELMKYVIQ